MKQKNFFYYHYSVTLLNVIFTKLFQVRYRNIPKNGYTKDLVNLLITLSEVNQVMSLN